MSHSQLFTSLLKEADEILKSNTQPLLSICRFLSKEIEHYNWVGFYFMNDSTQTLEIGPYVGLETEHTRIPYGKGICGQVANSAETFVVSDVHSQDNYLACSIDTKAEIVVPLFLDDKMVGQIDIDSNKRDPFTQEDEYFLKSLCELISRHPKSFVSHLP